MQLLVNNWQLLENNLATVGKHFQTKMTQPTPEAIEVVTQIVQSCHGRSQGATGCQIGPIGASHEGAMENGLTRDSADESDQGRSESREAHHSQTRGTTAGLEQDSSDQRVETHSQTRSTTAGRLTSGGVSQASSPIWGVGGLDYWNGL